MNNLPTKAERSISTKAQWQYSKLHTRNSDYATKIGKFSGHVAPFRSKVSEPENKNFEIEIKSIH